MKSSHSDESSSSSDSSDHEITSAVTAYKHLLDETVLQALHKDYSSAMTVIRAFADVFCEEEKFSISRTAKIAGALAIGAFASIFVVNTSEAAAKIIQEGLIQLTGYDIAISDVLAGLFKFGNVTGSFSLGSFTGMKLIENYFGHTSEAEKFLTYEKGTCAEKSKKIGRKVFDLLCAIAASAPTFFLTRSSGDVPAALTAIANTGITWFGVSKLPLTLPIIIPLAVSSLLMLMNN